MSQSFTRSLLLRIMQTILMLILSAQSSRRTMRSLRVMELRHITTRYTCASCSTSARNVYQARLCTKHSRRCWKISVFESSLEATNLQKNWRRRRTRTRRRDMKMRPDCWQKDREEKGERPLARSSTRTKRTRRQIESAPIQGLPYQDCKINLEDSVRHPSGSVKPFHERSRNRNMIKSCLPWTKIVGEIG